MTTGTRMGWDEIRCDISYTDPLIGHPSATTVGVTCDGMVMSASEHRPVIVTGLLLRGNLGLLVHRSPARRWYPDCWDLPGGHAEGGEKPADALRRELAEELGVTASVVGPADRHFLGETFHMSTWVVHEWVGDPTNREPDEHDAIAWVSYQDTRTLKLAHTGLSAFLRNSLVGEPHELDH